MKGLPGGRISFVAISQQHAQVTGSESPQAAASDDPLAVVTAERFGNLKLTVEEDRGFFFFLSR